MVLLATASEGAHVTINLLVDPRALDGDEMIVEGDAYHHLFRAARAATGDAVRLVDGRGRAREGKVVRVERRSAVIGLGAEASSQEPRLAVELLVAAPRPSRASWLVEKGTELGVRAFRFLDCERSARSLDGSDLDRLGRVARAAVEQCGRAWLPEVTGARSLADLLAARDGGPVVVLDPGAPAPLGVIDADGLAGRSASIVVGPEGGLTDREVDLCLRAGARTARLTPAVLRVETAALAAAACLILAAER